MRSTKLIPLLALCTATILAQEPHLPDVPGISFDDNPPCAIPCILAGINQTHCSINDQACLCRDEEYIKHVESCSALSCPLKYALQVQNVTWTACDFPLNDEVAATKVARIVLFAVLPTLSIILRVITKFARLSPWGWDDYTIIVSYVILLGYVCLHMYLENNGAGKDLWTLSDQQITNFFKAFYALQTLYHSSIDLIKVSILFMYLRIFHLPGEKVRIVLWVTLILNVINGLCFIFIGLFQCKPVSLAWTFWTGEATGKCIEIVKLALAHVGINIFLDVWMIIIPLSQVWKMNMALKKKFAVMFMFGLGLFLTAVTCYRITQILEFKKYPLNPTVAMMPSLIWSDIELYVGVFIACIPNLRQFFVRFILRKSEKKERLSSAMSEARNSAFISKSKKSQQQSDIDTICADESYTSSPRSRSSLPHLPQV